MDLINADKLLPRATETITEGQNSYLQRAVSIVFK